jgi:hypothetical protein
MILPFTPAAKWFGFVPPPLGVTSALWVIVAAYLALAEMAKQAAIGKSSGLTPRPGRP